MRSGIVADQISSCCLRFPRDWDVLRGFRSTFEARYLKSMVVLPNPRSGCKKRMGPARRSEFPHAFKCSMGCTEWVGVPDAPLCRRREASSDKPWQAPNRNNARRAWMFLQVKNRWPFRYLNASAEVETSVTMDGPAATVSGDAMQLSPLGSTTTPSQSAAQDNVPPNDETHISMLRFSGILLATWLAFILIGLVSGAEQVCLGTII